MPCIRKSLLTEYENNHIGLIKRRNGKIHGLDYLDQFFGNMLVKNITSPLLREFIAKLQSRELQRIVRENNPKEKRAVKPMGNGTINRVLALLRKAMNIARKDGLIHAVPYFPMLREDNVRTGFVETDQFKTILSHLPEHLHPLMIFLYRTGCRVGAALQITWEMVSGDATTMTLPAKIVKNKEPITLALTAELTAVLKKQFRQTGQPVFDATNLRREWASATVAAKCPELLIHDLRRSGARNLVNAGVPETVAMKIGGWKTRSVFIRYAIVATKDIQNAMNALEKNDGTLMEPDARLAQR